LTSESPFYYYGHAVKVKVFKVAGMIALVIFVLCIPAFLICSNLRWAANSVWLYDYEFGKHNVSEATGMGGEDLRLAAQELIDYFNSGYIAAFAIGGFILLKRRFWSSLSKGLVGGGALTIALLLAVGVAALANFDWLFLGFHRLFFRSDTWILNPATDYLIMIFPEGLFYDIGLYVVGAIVVEAVVLGGIGGFCLLRRQKRGG
jgi:hypothetical protein